jgi:hypothetical protein
MAGLAAATMLCSEIFVRCFTTSNINTNTNNTNTNTNTNDTSGTIFNPIKFKSLKVTFASIMILRVLFQSLLLKYYAISTTLLLEAALCNVALVALGLLLLLLTHKRARAHIGTRLRNRLASLGLEPDLVLHWPDRSTVQPQSPPVALALVQLNGDVSR